MHTLQALKNELATVWELQQEAEAYTNYDRGVPSNVAFAIKASETRTVEAINTLWPTLCLTQRKELLAYFTQLELNVRNYLHI